MPPRWTSLCVFVRRALTEGDDEGERQAVFLCVQFILRSSSHTGVARFTVQGPYSMASSPLVRRSWFAALRVQPSAKRVAFFILDVLVLRDWRDLCCQFLRCPRPSRSSTSQPRPRFRPRRGSRAGPLATRIAAPCASRCPPLGPPLNGWSPKGIFLTIRRHCFVDCLMHVHVSYSSLHKAQAMFVVSL